MGASGSGLVEPYGWAEPGPSGATTERGCANPRSTPGSGRLRLAYAGETGGRERLGAIVAPCTDTHAATRSVTAANAAYAAGRPGGAASGKPSADSSSGGAGSPPPDRQGAVGGTRGAVRVELGGS